MQMGWSRCRESNIYACTDAFTHSNQGLGPEEGSGWDTYTGPYKGAHVCMPLHKGGGAEWGVKWKCIHVLMNAHILLKKGVIYC